MLLPFAGAVDCLVWPSARGESEVAVYLMPTQECRLRPVETLDLTFPVHELTVESVDAGTLVAEVERSRWQRTLDATTALSTAGLCARMLGASQACLDAVVEHLKTREQFGRAIGTFQALQHKAADMAILVEGMRSFVAKLESDLRATGACDPRVLRRAKAYAGDAYRTIAETCLQLYGGVGYTWEHDVHLHLRHAHRCAQMLGDPATLRARA